MDRTRKDRTSPDKDPLADDVARLSRLLTKERESLPAAYLRDPGLRKAYRAYFLPPNLVKIGILLRELDLHPAGLLRKPLLRILDLGSGQGTAVLGMLEYFLRTAPGTALEFTAVDQVGENLREAEVLFRERAGSGRETLTTVRSNIETIAGHAGDTFDLIVLSNVLNELYTKDADRSARRAMLVADIVKHHLAPDGSCIIIEPALRETSRDLLLVRDALAASGLTVYSPCLVQGHCPALDNPKDWCHEDRHWDAPEAIREIDMRIGLRKDSLKFSYVVLRRDGRTLADCFGTGAYRVVSEQLVSKGKRELYLCGREGRRLAMRQDKDASPQNAAFKQLLRGDVVHLEGMTVEEHRFRITKETRVTPVPVAPDAHRAKAGS